MPQGDGCQFASPQHARQFIHARFVLHGLDGGGGAVLTGGFGDDKVMLAAGGHVRQVRDANDLPGGGYRAEFFADGVAHLAADIGVHFVEDQYRHAVVLGENCFNGEHDTGDFAAGGDGAQWPGRFAGVGLEGELDVVQAGRAGRFRWLNGHVESAVGETEVAQFACDGRGEFRGGRAASFGEVASVSFDLGGGGADIGFELGGALAAGLEVVKLAACVFEVIENGRQGGAVFSFETVKGGHAFFDPREPVGVGFNHAGKRGQRMGEFLGLSGELTGIGAPRFGFRYDADEFGEMFLRRAQGAECGGVVALQSFLDCAGQFQDALGVGDAGVFVEQFGFIEAVEVGLFDLADLEREKINLLERIAGLVAEGFKLVLEVEPVAPGFFVGATLWVVMAERIEQVELGIAVQE